MITKIKKWLRNVGVDESEIILDKATYEKLQEKYDETDLQYKASKTQVTLLESERDYLDKQLTELKKKQEAQEKKISVLEACKTYNNNRYNELKQEYDKIKDYNAQVTFNTDKPEKPKKQVKQKKHKTRPVIYGKNSETGVIKEYDDYYLLYARNPINTKTYAKKGELEPLKKCLKIFNERGNPYNSFYDICKEIIPDKRFKGEEKHIYLEHGKYAIKKSYSKNHKTTSLYFGAFETLEQAKQIRDYLMFVDWDISYLPRNVCSKTRGKPNMEEYYTLMKVYIETDSKYQEYLGNKESKAFYD